MIRAGVCNSWKREIVRGEHQAGHIYKLALYTDGADLTPATTAYNPSGEVRGDGYPTGGITLTGFRVSGGTTACLDFDNVTLKRASISADGGLVYNATLGKAVAVVKFAETITSTNGPFSLEMPPVGETSSLVRIA